LRLKKEEEAKNARKVRASMVDAESQLAAIKTQLAELVFFSFFLFIIYLFIDFILQFTKKKI
jgi:hypothetical protein